MKRKVLGFAYSPFAAPHRSTKSYHAILSYAHNERLVLGVFVNPVGLCGGFDVS